MFLCSLIIPLVNSISVPDIDLSTFSPDPSSSTGFRIYGPSTGSWLGRAVAGVGDVNGDGFDDVLAGAYLDSQLFSSAGSSYLVFGHRKTEPFSNIQTSSMVSSSATGISIVGANAQDNSGFAMDAAGDFNNDGFADYIIGSQGATAGSDANAGMVIIVLGLSNSSLYDTLDLSAPGNYVHFQFFGASAGGKLGSAVSAAGDFNGDGYDDVLMAAPYAGTNDVGNTFLIFGRSTADIQAANPMLLSTFSSGPSSGILIVGEGLNPAGDISGRSVGPAGDINGDGFDDIVIGAPGVKIGGIRTCGAAYVVFGRGAGGDFTDIFLSSFSGITYYGPQSTSGQFGSVVRGAGDINHDGYADIVVGDPSANAYSGVAYVIYGSAGLSTSSATVIDLLTSPFTGFRLVGAAAGDQLGASVSGVGDVNGDGIDDLVVAAPVAQVNTAAGAGTTYVVYGKVGNFNDIDLSGVVSADVKGYRILGFGTNAYSGGCVRGAGDVNGDGIKDLIIGAPQQSPNGAVYVVFGRLAVPDSSLALSELSLVGTDLGYRIAGAKTEEYAGIAISSAGDVNSDGIKDIIIGAPEGTYSGRNNCGKVYVVPGSLSRLPGSLVDLAHLNATAACSLRGGYGVIGDAAGAALGTSVAGIGDFNGDGRDDIIVTAPYASINGAYVIFSPAPSSACVEIDLNSLVVGSTGFQIIGTAGASGTTVVASAGDINGDGKADILVGVSLADYSGRVDCGIVYVLLSGANPSFGNVALGNVYNGNYGYRILGKAGGDKLGTDVKNAGDVNGDGYPDIIISAPYTSAPSRASSGKVYVLYTNPTPMGGYQDIDLLTDSFSGFTILGAAASDYIGMSIAGVDINGDGYSDVMVGASNKVVAGRTSAGAVYVVFGRPGIMGTVDLAAFPASRSTGFMIYGGTNYRLGQGLNFAGDVNRDGIADLLIRCPGVKKTFVLYGQPYGMGASDLDFTAFQSGVMGFEISGGEYNGVVTAVLDVNGDQIDDILLSSVEDNALGRIGVGLSYVIYGRAIYQSSRAPTTVPTAQPSTRTPTVHPTTNPTASPSLPPTVSPTRLPTYTPTAVPSNAGNRLDRTVTAAVEVGGGIKLTGTTLSMGVGNAVASLGDFDGDGKVDFAVTASVASPLGRTQAGIVYVLYGGSRTNLTSVIDMDTWQTGPSLGFRILGAAAGDKVGSSISAGGYDLNEDGRADLLVSAPYATVNGKTTAGIVYVIFGHLYNGNIDLSTFNTSWLGFPIYGAAAGERIGFGSMTFIRDFNGDGHVDIALGSFSATYNSVAEAGAVYLLLSLDAVFPTAMIDLSTVTSGAAAQIIRGSEGAQRFGNRVADAGNVNGDGYSDLLIGSNYLSYPPLTGIGGAYVLYGNNGGFGNLFPDALSVDIGATVGGFRMYGNSDGDRAGSSVAGLGDVNGDGIDDFAVTASLAKPLGRSKAGICYILYGRSTGFPAQLALNATGGTVAGYQVYGPHTNAYAGLPIVPAGDLNGDGFKDFILNSYGYLDSGLTQAGAVFVLFGGPYRSLIDLSQLTDPGVGFKITGTSANMQLGYSSAVGDFNGDGRRDFLVGSYFQAFLVDGQLYPSLAPTRAPSTTPTMKPTAPTAIPTIQPSNPTAIPTYSPTTLVLGNARDRTLGESDFTMAESTPNQYFGMTTASIGDFNGDGIKDFAVSSIYSSPFGRSNAGKVMVFYGQVGAGLSGTWNATLCPTSPQYGVRIFGAAVNHYTGNSLTGGLDFNDDGRDDLVIGVPNAAAFGKTTAGIVYVIFGAAYTADIDLASFVSGPTGFIIRGAMQSDRVGASIALLRDFNADGRVDLAVGSPSINLSNTSYGGVYVLYGRGNVVYSDVNLRNFTTGVYGVVVRGSGVSQSFGVSICDAGDFNGDGISDLLIGAHFFRTDLTRGFLFATGGAYILYGYNSTKTGVLPQDVFIAQLGTVYPGLILRGTDERGRAGQVVVGLGDVNGDGIDDVAITARFANPFDVTRAGVLYVVFGEKTLPSTVNTQVMTIYLNSSSTAFDRGFAIIGAREFDQLSWTVAAAGDQNGDGLQDILVSAWGYDAGPHMNAGAVYVVYGSLTPDNVKLARLDDSTVGYKITGVVTNQQIGVSLAAADINADGMPDVLIGAPYTSNYGGELHIFYNIDVPTTRPTAAPSTTPSTSPTRTPTVFSYDIDLQTLSGDQGFAIYGATASAGAGYSVSGLGDVNGDGYNDFALSTYYGSPLGRSSASTVHVLYGHSPTSAADRGFPNINLANFVGGPSTGYVIYGTAESARLTGIAAAGDFNQDGIDDFILTSYGELPFGAAYVLFGSSTLTSAALDLAGFVPSAERGFKVIGSTTYPINLFADGGSDLNGDGIPDVVISCPLADGLNRTDAGAVIVLFGRSSAAGVSNIDLSTFVSGPLGYRILGSDAGLRLGLRLAIIGDYNQDGRNDLALVSYVYTEPIITNCVHIIYSPISSTYSDIDLANVRLGIDGMRYCTAPMANQGAFFITTAGDVNGDGRPDVLVGALRASTLGRNRNGAAYVLFGRTYHNQSEGVIDINALPAGYGMRIHGAASYDIFARGVAPAGDFNGDGVGDLIITAQNASVPGRRNNGRTYIVYGSRSWSSETDLDLSTLVSGPSTGFQIYGAAATDLFGYSAALIGDIDGDGLSEIMLGSFYADSPTAVDSGAAYVMFGQQWRQVPTPTALPTIAPTLTPTEHPSIIPTVYPTHTPSVAPTTVPTVHPTTDPTISPSMLPSVDPTIQPSTAPTTVPSVIPTADPTAVPSVSPTADPTAVPSVIPTVDPTTNPTAVPSVSPTADPTAVPSVSPTADPTAVPSVSPTTDPTAVPSMIPTADPTAVPSVIPSADPTADPTAVPSVDPTTDPTAVPSVSPTADPTADPTAVPSVIPTADPTADPTAVPSVDPTTDPTALPSVSPTTDPTVVPSVIPTADPTTDPTADPTAVPSVSPTADPTADPTAVPSVIPTADPTADPTAVPSVDPTTDLTALPSVSPTTDPTVVPSVIPTADPTTDPTAVPSGIPTADPTADPTAVPSVIPTADPTAVPSVIPTADPTAVPSASPSVAPSANPTFTVTSTPSVAPSVLPSVSPTTGPSMYPTVSPTAKPSAGPTRSPSALPTDPAPAAAPDITGIAMSANRTSLVATVRIASLLETAVYCAALRPTAVSTLTSADILRHNQLSYAVQGVAVIPLTGLVPSTAYAVYCTTRTAKGATLTSAKVLQSSVSTRTNCCKHVMVTLSRTSLLAGATAAQALSVGLDFPPSVDMSVVATFLAPVSAPSGWSTAVAYPSTLRYTNASFTTQSAMLVAGSLGEHKLSVGLTGAAASEFSVVFATSRTLTVLPSNAEPPLPSLVSAVFSADGSRVTVLFDAPTNKGGLSNVFACTALFQFPGASTARCQWADSTSVTVFPTYSVQNPTAVLRVASALTLRGGLVQAACPSAASTCSSWALMPSGTVQVASLTSVTAPVVSMSVPETSSDCLPLPIDLSSSVGSAGRQWESVDFTVLTSPVNALAAQQLRTFLQSNYSTGSPTLVPALLLETGLTYSIRLTLCNFLGACGSALKSVTIVSSDALLPIVSIQGSPRRSIQRSNMLSLLSDAYTQTCRGVVSYANMQLSWQLASLTPAVTVPPSLRSSALTSTAYRLIPYSLRSNAVYSVTLTATSALSGLSTSYSVVVTVQASNLVAQILGGSALALEVGHTGLIDASKSYDQDVQGATGTAAGLVYSWSCAQTHPIFSSASCPVSLVPTTIGGQRVNVTAQFSAMNTTSMVTVTVTDSTGARSSNAQVAVSVVSVVGAQVSISAAQTSLQNINTDKTLALFGSVRAFAPCTATWSVDDASVVLSRVSATPVQTQLLAQQAHAVPFNLVILGGSLPQRATLLFSLRCGTAENTITVTTNGAPLPGSFTALPSSGEELSTVFQLSAAQWSDSDLPLTYQFGFYTVGSTSPVPVQIKQSQQSFTASTLPAGDSTQDYSLQCSLSVRDSIGAAAATVTALVRVAEQAGAEAQQSSLVALMNSSTGSTDNAKSIISVAAAVVNRVNCTGMTHCTALNRTTCSSTSRTCGHCLPGYIGEPGDANSACIYASSQQSVFALKHCSNCSEHGACSLVSSVTGRAVSQCSLQDPSCQPVCTCEVGFTGRVCELSLQELDFRRALRADLLSSLDGVTGKEDADSAALASWSAGLSALTQDPYELSVDAAAQALRLANNTITAASTAGLDSLADLEGVLGATDRVFSAPGVREAQNSTAGDILQVIGAFASMKARSLYLGQNRTTASYSNFQLSAEVGAAGDGNLTVSAPQTDSEVSAGAPAVRAVIAPSGTGADGGSVAVSMVSLYPSAYSTNTEAFTSRPLFLQVSNSEGDDIAGNNVGSIDFTFPFLERQTQFLNYAPRNFSSTCRQLTENFSYVCPDSGYVVRHDCSSLGLGEYNSVCPKPQPTCAKLGLHSAAMTVLSACRVVNFTDSEVTCSCDLTTAVQQARRLSGEKQVLDDSGATNMVATMSFIALEFADTFNAASRFNDPAAVMIVIVMFATFWGAGLLLLSACFVKNYVSMQKKLKLMSRQVIAAVTAAEKGANLEDARERLLSYIDNVFPSVYSGEKSKLHRLACELRTHHRYLTLFTLGDGQLSTFGKVLIIVQVLTMETMQMFLLAVMYDLQGPENDGSCVSHMDEGDCLSRKSIFDSSQSYCQWSYDGSTDSMQCSYDEPSMTMTVFIYILILTSIATAMLNTPLDYLFKICAAPLIEEAMEAQVANTREADRRFSVVKGLRRLSVQAGNAAQAVGRRGSAVIDSTQKFVQKRLWYTSLLMTAKEKAADTVIADREISEELQQRHKEASAGLSGLVRHSETLLGRRERMSLRLKQRAEDMRTLSLARLDKQDSTAEAVDLSEELSGDKVGEHRPSTLTGSVTASMPSIPKFQSITRFSPKRSSAVAVAPGGTETHRVLMKLQDEVLCQRLLLPADSPAVLKVYDAQWGIVPASETGDVHCISDEALAAIGEDIETSELEAKELNELMPRYTVQHGGLAVLNMFLLDLLGRRTIAAKIFKNKFEEDFEHTKAVSQAFKASAVLLLVGCNAFFIYYSLLKALQKGHTWQYHYLQGCIAQMIIEVFLNETLECIWLNYVVPDLARKEVHRVHAILGKVVEQITDQTQRARSLFFLDAPSYLFSSTKVARSHPSLLESVIVRNFHSHLPGELCRSWPHYQQHVIDTGADEMLVDPDAAVLGSSGFKLTNNFLFRAILALGTATVLSMQYLGTFPFNIQRIFIRFVQPLLLSGLTLLWLFASSSLTALIVVICMSAVVIMAFLWRQWYLHALEQRNSKRVQPSSDVDCLDPDQDPGEQSDEASARAGGRHRAGSGDSNSSSSSSSSSSSDSEEDSDQDEDTMGSGSFHEAAAHSRRRRRHKHSGSHRRTHRRHRTTAATHRQRRGRGRAESDQMAISSEDSSSQHMGSHQPFRLPAATSPTARSQGSGGSAKKSQRSSDSLSLAAPPPPPQQSAGASPRSRFRSWSGYGDGLLDDQMDADESVVYTLSPATPRYTKHTTRKSLLAALVTNTADGALKDGQDSVESMVEVSDSSVDTEEGSSDQREQQDVVHYEEAPAAVTSSLRRRLRSTSAEYHTESSLLYETSAAPQPPIPQSPRLRGRSFGATSAVSSTGTGRPRRFESFDAPSPYMSEDEEY